MVEAEIARGWRGQFVSFRVNLESVPRLPAAIVRRAFEDPRKVPYLLTWTSRVGEGTLDAIRVSQVPDFSDVVELKRAGDGREHVRLAWAELPRGKGRTLLLVCSGCSKPRRFLYGMKVAGYCVLRSSWVCRACAGLQYASEGRSRGGLFRRAGFEHLRPLPLPRFPLDPDVFTDPRQASIVQV